MFDRLFILDKDENLITGFDLQSDSDGEALNWTSFVLSSGRIGELWCGTRCVGRATSAEDRPRRHALHYPGRDSAGETTQAAFSFR